MLASKTWQHLGTMWDEDKRKEINLAWHKLDGTLSRIPLLTLSDIEPHLPE